MNSNMERIDVLAAMEGQRVVLTLTLAAAATIKGVLFAVDPWSKSVLLLLEPEQRQQRVPAGLPSCIYVEGRQIKSWRRGDDCAGGAAAFGGGDGVTEGPAASEELCPVSKEWYTQCERALGAAALDGSVGNPRAGAADTVGRDGREGATPE